MAEAHAETASQALIRRRRHKWTNCRLIWTISCERLWKYRPPKSDWPDSPKHARFSNANSTKQECQNFDASERNTELKRLIRMMRRSMNTISKCKSHTCCQKLFVVGCSSRCGRHLKPVRKTGQATPSRGHAVTHSGRTLDRGHFRAGSFVDSSDRAFQSLLGISVYATREAKTSLSRLAVVRAALVHHNGNISALPIDLHDGSLLTVEALGLYIESDLHHSYFVPSAGYVPRSLSMVAEHLASLSARVEVALKSSRKNGA